MEKVLIIGAANIDYIGMINDDIIMNDSNKGMIRVSFGGVGRNICENLARLKTDITFITVIGSDSLGKQMLAELEHLGVNVIFPDNVMNTSSYMAIHDHTGDMLLAINDMDIFNLMDVPYLQSLDHIINKFDYLICDGNLTQETIDYIFNTYHNQRILVDGISTKKVMKFANHLDKIYLLKCNIYEAQALVKKEIYESELLSQLLALGCKQVVVTYGTKDIYYSDGVQIYKTNVTPIKDIVNATGAGDAMFAGITYQLLSGKTIQEGVEFGKKLSTLTLSSPGAVSTDIGNLIE